MSTFLSRFFKKKKKTGDKYEINFFAHVVMQKAPFRVFQFLKTIAAGSLYPAGNVMAKHKLKSGHLILNLSMAVLECFYFQAAGRSE